MPVPLLPIAGAALGAGARFVGGQITRRLSQSALQQQALKQGVMGASGFGVLSASPAQAPGTTQRPDAATVSPEARQPEAAQSSLPDFATTFGP